AVLLILLGISIRGLLAPFQAAGLGITLVASPLGAGVLAGIGAGTAALVAFKVLPALAGVGVGWSPYLAGAGGLAMVGGGLAALPPLAGFFGELAVAAGLARSGLFWLAGAGLLGGVLSLCAVLRLLAPVYLLPPPDEARRTRESALSTPVSLAGAALAGVAC